MDRSMPLVSEVGALNVQPNRILVAGVSGSGKSSLCRQLHIQLALPYVELDSLFHGPNWSVRTSFEAEVDEFISQDCWVLEWQYDQVRQRLLSRAELLIWLDYPLVVVMKRVIWRTIRRNMRHEPLWNGNVEPPLWTILTNPEHIIRWAWRTRASYPGRIRQVFADHPDLLVLRITDPHDARRVLEALRSS
ncbi:MAG: AAA family ATPase [Ferrimicrobium sp.]